LRSGTCNRDRDDNRNENVHAHLCGSRACVRLSQQFN
jgi:hypothetical protein